MEWIKDISVYSSDKAFSRPIVSLEHVPLRPFQEQNSISAKNAPLVQNSRPGGTKLLKQLLLRAEGEQLQLPRAIIPAAQGLANSQREAKGL